MYNSTDHFTGTKPVFGLNCTIPFFIYGIIQFNLLPVEHLRDYAACICQHISMSNMYMNLLHDNNLFLRLKVMLHADIWILH